MNKSLSLKILNEEYSIHQCAPKYSVPDTVSGSEFLSVSHTPDETTIICRSNIKFDSQKKDGDWRCIQLVGEFDLEIKGVWARITSIVAEAGSPVLAITTFDTDYFLVKAEFLEPVKNLFIKKNFRFI
tara:strand:- start:1330 stop:1713 length:384 start_codon:yes stop_codon:yes gene_type:complete